MKTYENKTIMNEYKKVQIYLGSQDALDQETISLEDEADYASDGIDFDWMFY